jgi:hypothetical protein
MNGSDSMSPTVPPISTMVHRGLDFIGDVGNDLDGFAEVIAAALLGNDLLVNATGGPIVIARKFGVGKAFVVAEVEIGLGAVVGNENLAVLEGRHRPWVHVEVRIELHQVDFQPTALQQAANRGRRQPLPERRHDSPGHKDVLCRHRFLTLNCL